MPRSCSRCRPGRDVERAEQGADEGARDHDAPPAADDRQVVGARERGLGCGRFHHCSSADRAGAADHAAETRCRPEGRSDRISVSRCTSAPNRRSATTNPSAPTSGRGRAGRGRPQHEPGHHARDARRRARRTPSRPGPQPDHGWTPRSRRAWYAGSAAAIDERDGPGGAGCGDPEVRHEPEVAERR